MLAQIYHSNITFKRIIKKIINYFCDLFVNSYEVNIYPILSLNYYILLTSNFVNLQFLLEKLYFLNFFVTIENKNLFLIKYTMCVNIRIT